jgi:hypothetical protein
MPVIPREHLRFPGLTNSLESTSIVNSMDSEGFHLAGTPFYLMGVDNIFTTSGTSTYSPAVRYSSNLDAAL